MLTFRTFDGAPPPLRAGALTIRRIGAPPPLSNIAAAHGLGPALADPSRDPDVVAHFDLPPVPEPAVLPTFEALGLVAEGAWTAAAETVLWRKGIGEWAAPPADPRFHEAVAHALDALPSKTRAEIDRLTTITEADIAAARLQHEAHAEETRLRFGAKARVGHVPDEDGLRNSLAFARMSELDRCFYRGWRLPDGWLDAAERVRALEILHDPLAQAMRRALVARLHPDRPDFSR